MPVFGTTKKESYRALQPAKEGVATAREAAAASGYSYSA